MKKLLSMTLVLAMAATMFAGCGSTEAPAEAPADSTAAVDQAVSEVVEATADTAAETTEVGEFTTVTEGVLTMATNAYFPPYEYYEGEKIVGIDAEIAEAVAKKLGLELQIEDMEFDSIITAVQMGKADIGLAGMTVTEERLQNINFSKSYAQGVQVVIVPEDSAIASIDDLQGKKIGVQLATTGDIYAKGDFGEENVEEFNKGNDAVNALVNSKIDAVIIDNEPAKAYVAANTGLKILESEYVTEDYAACISKDNEALLAAVDAALDELTADGTIQSILDKYIAADAQ